MRQSPCLHVALPNIAIPNKTREACFIRGGFMFALDVRIALIAAIVFAVVFFITRYVSVGSLTITALFPILMLIFYPGQWVVFGLSLIFTALAWWRHRANIKRLMNGTENKFEKKKK